MRRSTAKLKDCWSPKANVPIDPISARMFTLLMYVPAGDIGMWQGALRNPDDPMRIQIADALEQRRPLIVELLYSDLVGRERTISRFIVSPVPANDAWLVGLSRHWFLDWDGPRPDTLWQAAGEAIQQDYKAYGAQAAQAADRYDI